MFKTITDCCALWDQLAFKSVDSSVIGIILSKYYLQVVFTDNRCCHNEVSSWIRHYNCRLWTALFFAVRLICKKWGQFCSKCLTIRWFKYVQIRLCSKAKRCGCIPACQGTFWIPQFLCTAFATNKTNRFCLLTPETVSPMNLQFKRQVFGVGLIHLPCSVEVILLLFLQHVKHTCMQWFAIMQQSM